MIDWAARHPTGANILMLSIILLGLVTLPNLQRETFPKLESDRIQVRIVYPGAVAAEVEAAICRRVEEALEGLANREELACDAREGVATATVIKREGAPLERFLDDINSAIDAIDDFPANTQTPIITELNRTDRVISVAVAGVEQEVALKNLAIDLKQRLLMLDGVADVRINGFSERQIRIEIPRGRLRQYGLSAQSIAATIGAHSVSSPVGRIEGGNEELIVRVDDQRRSVDTLADIVVVASSQGARIRLGDIAKISDRFERDEERIIFNGQRAAILDVEKARDDDLLDVFERVSAFIAEERARSSPNLRFELTQNTASIVQDRLQMLIKNGLQGLLLVFLVLWLFFNLRYSFWVAMGLPVSFLGAFYLLPFLGITINMISMVGLLIGVGLLMDDAIVIAENIAARLQRGDRPMDAAVHGLRDVLPGILSSFATTLLVFGSLAFISGQIGQILRTIPIVLILVISVSLIEAMLILPSHLGHSLAAAKSRPSNRFRDRFESAFGSFRDRVFVPLIDRAIDYRYLTLGVVIMLILISIAMPVGGKIKFVAFPDIDGDIIEARVLLPQGTPLSRTEQIVARIEQALVELNLQLAELQPSGQPLVKNITVIYGQNPNSFESGPHLARIVGDLLAAETRTTSIDTLRQLWRDKVGNLPDVISVTYSKPTLGPGGRAIDLRLYGDDLTTLKAASGDLQNWLAQHEGVIDLTDDLRPGKRELQLQLKPGAEALGVSARTLTDQIRPAFQGIEIDEFPLHGETFTVDLRLTGNERNQRTDLERMFIITPSGGQVPLPLVAAIQEVRGWSRINRIDGQRTVSVQGDVDRDLANAQELIALARATFFPQLLARYPGVRFEVQGQSNESAETGQSIVRNVLLGLIGVYLLLALQFRGYLAPLAVIAVIPSALIGVIFGHLALGLDLTMPSIVGMASLFGVVVNDSILLVTFIRNAYNSGARIPEAAGMAARARFRAIVLTSITTIAGLTPLLAETSLQAQILIPLAASLAFGLTSATLVALFLVPALYCILDDLHLLGDHGQTTASDVSVAHQKASFDTQR